ncbi:hypothetical protein LguiA_033470 [Lonicera macranthoides]
MAGQLHYKLKWKKDDKKVEEEEEEEEEEEKEGDHFQILQTKVESPKIPHQSLLFQSRIVLRCEVPIGVSSAMLAKYTFDNSVILSLNMPFF